VTIYNLANGLLFCFLAGAMVTVSATAVGVPFPDVKMPGFSDTLPTGVAWSVVVILIGAAMTAVAVKGYAWSRVANYAAPWMFLVFLACAFATLPKLESLELSKIWTGIPQEGKPKIGFWGVFFFAWFCNAAMHLGMSDMSVLRYAKKPPAAGPRPPACTSATASPGSAPRCSTPTNSKKSAPVPASLPDPSSSRRSAGQA
jgi:nucleobase:cation symporter-1, NCS1 family